MSYIEQLGQQMATTTGQGILGQIFGAITARSNDRRQIRQSQKLQDMQIRGQEQLTDYNTQKQLEMWKNTSYPAQMEQLQKSGTKSRPTIRHGRPRRPNSKYPTGGSITIDTINLSKKVYEMLNRIAVSGGSYDDWLDAVYDHDRITRAETPIYHGGLIKELVFQEVVSNSASTDGNTQPLGTLAGKGIMASKHKGGQIRIKVDEPSYIMGIVSLTPRIDYSQGNKWDVNLQTLDDLHKPGLDEIGFQELITEQMAWWSTEIDQATGNLTYKSAGKQPAWINYMTNVNQIRGNFAIQSNEMFMTLNRRYEPDTANDGVILDLTTYIDPAKFNFIFAQTALDAQNFWAQIAVDMTVRRKMSAKVMPNL